MAWWPCVPDAAQRERIHVHASSTEGCTSGAPLIRDLNKGCAGISRDSDVFGGPGRNAAWTQRAQQHCLSCSFGCAADMMRCRPGTAKYIGVAADSCTALVKVPDQ